MITIEQNNYKQPTEVREEVVQGICEAFIDNCAWSVYHPCSVSCYRRATPYIVRHASGGKFYGFMDEVFSHDVGIRIRGCEMKQAFAELDAAGYYMFRVYEYGVWKGYKCERRPVCSWPNSERVYTFNDFID